MSDWLADSEVADRCPECSTVVRVRDGRQICACGWSQPLPKVRMPIDDPTIADFGPR